MHIRNVAKISIEYTLVGGQYPTNIQRNVPEKERKLNPNSVRIWRKECKPLDKGAWQNAYIPLLTLLLVQL